MKNHNKTNLIVTKLTFYLEHHDGSIAQHSDFSRWRYFRLTVRIPLPRAFGFWERNLERHKTVSQMNGIVNGIFQTYSNERNSEKSFCQRKELKSLAVWNLLWPWPFFGF